jgi:hypothetical protein
LDNPAVLGEYLGKAAATIWLYDELGDFEEVATCFALSLKYYQRASVDL